MTSETPATAPLSSAGGSGPAARSFCRRPTSPPIPAASRPDPQPDPKPTPKPGQRPRATRWIDPQVDPDWSLYGTLLADVVLLRRRGFGVHREGDFYRVGNRLLDADGLRAVAARERRLLDHP